MKTSSDAVAQEGAQNFGMKRSMLRSITKYKPSDFNRDRDLDQTMRIIKESVKPYEQAWMRVYGILPRVNSHLQGFDSHSAV